MDRTGNEVVTVSQLRSVRSIADVSVHRVWVSILALMLAFGESIEASVGVTLGLSTMAAAAVGTRCPTCAALSWRIRLNIGAQVRINADEVKMTKSGEADACSGGEIDGAMTGVTINDLRRWFFPIVVSLALFVCMYVFMYRYLKIYFCARVFSSRFERVPRTLELLNLTSRNEQITPNLACIIPALRNFFSFQPIRQRAHVNHL